MTLPGPSLSNQTHCLEWIGYRARALPIHSPDLPINNQAAGDSRSNGLGGFNSTNPSVTFEEGRPYKSQYYYVLVVSKGRIFLKHDPPTITHLKSLGPSIVVVT